MLLYGPRVAFTATGEGKPAVDATALPAERREGHPGMFLSWNAPYGLPGASDAISVSCDDTTRVDTLYMTFDPGEDVANLLAVDATLTFRAAPGDSLGPFWDMARSGANPWNLRLEFDEPPPGCPSPWPVSGSADLSYRLRKDAGELNLSYFVPASQSGPVAGGSRYFYARVMIRLRRGYLKGCGQPVCIELSRLLVGLREGGRPITAGERFVSWNSPGGKVCADYRKRGVMPWPVAGGAPPDTAR